MKNFLVIDDHAVVRSGLRTLFSELFKPCNIYEAINEETSVEKLKERDYDLVMMDIQMPKTDTVGLMEYIRVSYPEARVLIFSMSAENIYAKRFMKAGARGFVSKEAPMEEIKKAISLILDGKKYISNSLADSLVEESFAGGPANPFQKLSAREFEIVTLLLAGNTLSDISKTLNIQMSTTGTHKARLFEKLSVTNILELKELATFYKL